MTTLLLSTWRLPEVRPLTAAARRQGWLVRGLDRGPEPEIEERVVFYGGSDVVDAVSSRFGLSLVEPSFDLLAFTPYSLRLRDVKLASYNELGRFEAPMFVKPADVRRKAFDAGIYRDVREARLEAPLDPEMPVLVAEPIEFLEEYRCFVLDGTVVATSTYLRFGRPSWRPFDERGTTPLPLRAQELCAQLLTAPGLPLPRAFVVDVGLIEGRGWGVVEYNPAWCSSLLGCNPESVLPVLECASQRTDGVCDRGRVGRPARACAHDKPSEQMAGSPLRIKPQAAPMA